MRITFSSSISSYALIAQKSCLPVSTAAASVMTSFTDSSFRTRLSTHPSHMGQQYSGERECACMCGCECARARVYERCVCVRVRAQACMNASAA